MNIAKMFDLTGKVALVTGGGRGMGLSIVRGLAAAGADVIIASRKLDSCEAAAREVEAAGRQALAVSCHLGDWDQVDALVEKSYARFGRVDVLVNNAGMAPVTPSSHETSQELFDKILNVNFKGPYRLSAAIGHRMAEGDGGSIINLSSTSALIFRPFDTAYAGAKAALNAATLSFAQEYAPKVRVNVVSPGPFATDISKHWTEEIWKAARASTALKRVADPDEMVATIVYLASDASSFTTGALLRVDGGLA
jgi:NAD(P)-dependent dehydrogenase (short-subunit alcohol dehydrogenase family)